MTTEKKKKKKKRKFYSYYVTVSNDPNVSARNHRMSGGSQIFWKVVVAVLAIVITGFIAYVNYNGTVILSREEAFKSKISELEETNAHLTADNAALTEKINILSETVNQKVEAEAEAEEKSVPNGFPLSVAADFEEKDEELRLDGQTVKRPMLVFKASDGAYVVAAGDGIVTLAAQERTYGYEVQVDHGNGYVTSYRTNTEPKVKEGDEVSRGMVLFEVDSDNDDLAEVAYQILQEGEYINPTDLLEING